MAGLLVAGPIDVEALRRETASPGCGGTCVFLGTVREGAAERAAGGVVAIEYAAYDAMAERELAAIRDEAHARWPGSRVAVRHRVGSVPVGEASIAIAAAAPHRAQAFEACRYVIEEVKRRLPIWKKEVRADGTGQWVDADGRPAPAPVP